MSINSFRTSLMFYTESVGLAAGQATISALPPMERSWKYVTHLHYEWDVSLPSAGTTFKLKVTRGRHSPGKVVYTTAPAKISFQVDGLVGTSVSESLVFSPASTKPAYAIYLVRRSLNLGAERHVSKVIARITEEMADMGPLTKDERLETLLDLLTEDYNLLVIDFQQADTATPAVEATTPFDSSTSARLQQLLKPFMEPLLAHAA